MSEQKNDIKKVVRVIVFILAFSVSGFLGIGILLFSSSLLLGVAGAGISLLTDSVAKSSDILNGITALSKAAARDKAIRKQQEKQRREQEKMEAEEKMLLEQAEKENARLALEEDKIKILAIEELEKEAEKFTKSGDYKPSEGKYFTFKYSYEYNSDWSALSNVKIGDCPAKSEWHIVSDEGECWSIVPSNCEAVTPKVIAEYKCVFEMQAELEPIPEPEPQAQPEIKPEIKPEAKPKQEVKPKAEAKPKAETKPEIKSEAKPKAQTHKTSFNCEKAKSVSEGTVCSNEDLAGLDVIMNRLYKPLAEDLEDSQKKWIKKRDKCESDVECLKKEYRARIKFLRSN